MNATLRILVLSTSLNSNSKSRRIAKRIQARLEEQGASVDWVDLQDHPLPFCDGQDSNKDPRALAMRKKVEEADGILMAAPIYNYDVNAAAKNFIELTGRAWTGKVVALAVAAGGQRSGMSPLGMMNSLMLDFRCIVLPRFVYISRGSYTDDGQPDEASMERIRELSDELIRIAGALAQR
jgi:NAD(P)H-dependent FMN reductase